MNNESKGSGEENHNSTPFTKSTRNETTTITTIRNFSTAISNHSIDEKDELEHVQETSAANEQETQKDNNDSEQKNNIKCWPTGTDDGNNTNTSELAQPLKNDVTAGNINVVVAGQTQKSDKSVCTHENLEDLQRAMTYEAVFNSLLEQKMIAMKRDCEERKRLKRMKRKSLGRRLFSKKLFSSRKSISGRLESQSQEMEVELNAGACLESTSGKNVTAKKTVTRSRTVDDIEIDSPLSSTSQGAMSLTTALPKSKPLRVTAVTPAVVSSAEGNADDSIASSTMSNSSGKQVVRRSVLVRAQTHTPAADTTLSSNSSGEIAAVAHSSTNGEMPQVSSLGQRTIYDTASMASGTVARLHSSTMAEDSFTSIRDSIESLSFASSRCTVSFGATEIIPEETASLILERVRAEKRMRMLEAKSISAQCSPIFPRHVTPTVQSVAQIRQLIPTTVPDSVLKSNLSQLAHVPHVPTIRPLRSSGTQTSRIRLLPNQLSYTDSMYGCALDIESSAAFSRNISRQNTSEDSANVTMSTLLNQSDSLSLQTPAFFAASSGYGLPDTTGRSFLSVNERSKSKSASLLVVSGIDPKISPPTVPTEQLEQLHISRDAGPIKRPLVSLDNTIIPRYSLEQTHPHYNAAVINVNDTKIKITNRNKHFNVDTNAIEDSSRLNRMTSTSTASSTAPTGCFAATKSFSREKDKQRFIANSLVAAQSGSDDEYRKRKRKYKRYHRCSDPALVYPTPNMMQHCVISLPTNEDSQFQYDESYAYDGQIGMDSDKHNDLEQIMPDSIRKHRRHRHHRHKKRRRHKKSKMLVQDIESQVVKVIHPDDLSQRARWTIIVTACLLLLMCLMLVGITLRMAPIIDDMVPKSPHV